jgi:hypothetical protein
MDESGVTAHPFNSRRRKVISLVTYPIEPHFQDIRDVNHVSIVGTVSFGLDLLPPLFLTVSHINFKDPEPE